MRTLLILSAWGCSILFIVCAPSEVNAVYSVKNAAAEKLRIENVHLVSESCGINHYCDYVKIKATKIESNLPVKELVEVEPGTFPFGIFFQRKQVWSTKRNYAEQYQIGEVYDAYLASNGRYYLSQGSYFPYAYLLALSVIWLLGNAIAIFRRKY